MVFRWTAYAIKMSISIARRDSFFTYNKIDNKI